MKVHILYPFIDGPWGGANQFLKAIKNYLIGIDKYTEDETKADVILFNSSPSALLLLLLSRVYKLKKLNPNLIIINRIDGPIYFIRDKDLEMDKAFQILNESICDGTIYQSTWSKEKNYFLGMKKNIFEITILNAPDSNIFNKKIKINENKKIKIISTSWSANIKKGFEIYKWLDENLNHTKYEFTFIGNSPIKFKNIIHKEPMNSERLAEELKKNDIFITASQKDPCSNSLIEALHCGLPAIGLNDGGHREIIANAGEVFDDKEEILILLDMIMDDYEKYQLNINLPIINEVGKQYYDFLEIVYNEQRNGKYNSKNFILFDYISLKAMLTIWKVKDRITNLKNRLFI
jgi:glycosyltransferase involved in cell wall biosynthesis